MIAGRRRVDAAGRALALAFADASFALAFAGAPFAFADAPLAFAADGPLAFSAHDAFAFAFAFAAAAGIVRDVVKACGDDERQRSAEECAHDHGAIVAVRVGQMIS